MCACICIQVLHMYVYTYENLHLCLYCIFACMHVCNVLCVHVYGWAGMCASIYMHMYVLVYASTQRRL